MMHDNRLLELDDNNFKSVVDFAASYKNKFTRKVRKATEAPVTEETIPASGTESGETIPASVTERGETIPVSGTESGETIPASVTESGETIPVSGTESGETIPTSGTENNEGTATENGFKDPMPAIVSENNEKKFDNALELVGNHSDIVFEYLAKVLDLEMKTYNITDRVKELLWSKISKRSIKEDAEELENKIREVLLSPEMKKDIEAALLKMAQEMEMLKNKP